MEILGSEFYESTQKIGSDKTCDTRDEDSFFYIDHILPGFPWSLTLFPETFESIFIL